MLVMAIFLSLIIDLLWFYISDLSSDADDGGIERSVKNFSRYMSYFSFFFRIIVALVFWKDSLDFTRVIKHKRDEVEYHF